MEEMIYVLMDELKDFSRQILKSSGVRSDIADLVAEGLVQTSLRGVDSHGIRLMPHYLRALKAGRINPDPTFRFEQTAAATGRLNGDHTFGYAAGMVGMEKSIKLAESSGAGLVSVYNSSHFGAAAYFALRAAAEEMIGFAFTHADSLMQSYAGERAYFGTNPLCMAAPCKDEDPFCLDMATSQVNWNKILQYRERDEQIPHGWGVDTGGNETLNAKDVTALQPIGKYKGFGLAMVVEILCSLLCGMSFGQKISKMYTDPIGEHRYLGHFFMAIKIDSFIDLQEFLERIKILMKEVRNEPPVDSQVRIMVPGDPEKKNKQSRLVTGIPIPQSLWEELKDLSKKHGLSLRSVND